MTHAAPRSAFPRFSSSTTRRRARLAPLLLALVVGQAYAAPVQRTGADGAAGASGSAASKPGGEGGAAPTLTHVISTFDQPGATLLLYGGGGGIGGRGWDDYPTPDSPDPGPGGDGGTGGAGGAVDGRASATHAFGDVAGGIYAFGGRGGEGGAGGCCFSPGGLGGMGGAATGVAEASSYGGGTATTQAAAFGGNGGAGGGGGAALAIGRGWSTAGAVAGTAAARGGNGGGLEYSPQYWPYRGGGGGEASAVLTLRGAGLVVGDVSAVGGDGTSSYLGTSEGGSGRATLELYGAGASGTSVATRGYGIGGGAVSDVRAITTGALAVDLSSRASAGAAGVVSADLYVDSGYGTPAAGHALVTGRSFAEGSDGASGQMASATLTLFGSGGIIGASDARAMDGWGDSCYYRCGTGGGAYSGASGISSGRYDVTITAYARGGAAHIAGEGTYLPGGNGQAVAYGRSAGGVVKVKAEAWSQGWGGQSPGARATAINTAAGGASFAEARDVAISDSQISYGNYSAAASASSVGSGGARALASGQGYYGDLAADADASASDGLGVVASGRASVSGFGAGSAESRANVGGALYGLPAFDGAIQAVSHVTGAPGAADVAALLAQSPELAAAAAGWRGAGVMAAAGADAFADITTQAGFTFSTLEGQHLLLGLFAPVSTYDMGAWLNFSISNNGVQLFSQAFGGDELDLFFNNRLLDLGLVGAGVQNLLISATWQVGAGAGYGFGYVIGVTAVPEPGAWLMMVLGLGGLLLVARRRDSRSASFHR